MESTKTKSDNKDEMSDAEESGKPERRESNQRQPSRPGPVADKSGYFHIYKKGQGYWTRMGTVAGAGLLGLFLGNFIYNESERQLTGQWITGVLDKIHLQDPRGPFIVVAIFAIIYSWIGFHFMNRPTNVDFLIATDSEMKKVNWTTQKELTGSTKIVIIFVVLMALILFFYDMLFNFLFWAIGVLKTPPFFMGH